MRARHEFVKAGAKVIPMLLEVLRNDTGDPIRVGALPTLEEIYFRKRLEPDRTVVSALTELVAGADSREVRCAAANALDYVDFRLPMSELGPVIEALTKAMAESEVRVSALSALTGLREKADAAVPEIKATLERALNSEPPDWSIIHLSLKALGQIGTRSSEVVALVLPLLNGSDPEMRRAALDALGGMPVAEAAADIVGALHDPRDWTRGNAAEAIVHIFSTSGGRALAAEVVPALLEHVKDPSDRVRAAVVSALESSSSTAAVRPVIEAMSDASAKVRTRAVWGLSHLLHDPGDAWGQAAGASSFDSSPR